MADEPGATYADEYAVAAGGDGYATDDGYTAYGYTDSDAYGLGLDGYDPQAYAGYVYDPASGEWVYAEGTEGVEGSYFALDEEPAPTSPFGDEAYWQQYGEDAVVEVPASPIESAGEGDASPVTPAPLVEGPEGSAEDALPVEATAETPDTASVPPSTPSGGASTKTPPSSSSQKSRRKKPKTKQERVEMRQAQLEKDEAEKQKQENAAGAPNDVAPGATPGSPGKRVRRAEPTHAPTFLERERAKVRLGLRKLRAIRRKRIPPQVRILTATRTRLSPMEMYFGGSVEAALSDVFWAAMKGDLRRVRFLVEVEQVSVTDAMLDPWHMEQTPLHWAAKGGDAAVIEYLLRAGANPRSLDENGSLPLHLACWAGHIDATLVLLRATDTKDLYVQDYDAALAPLDWAQLRGHTALVKAIERYEDATWLPKFVDDLVRGIIRYKIKLYKEPPKSPKSPARGLQFRRAGGAGVTTTTEHNNQIQPQNQEGATTKLVDASKPEGNGPETMAPVPASASSAK